ncbi:hypothetical protein ACWJJH_15290 [Endozoicomonadaceae bacterium StTr2]
MKFVNRCVVTLTPGEKFRDWVKENGDEVPEIWDFEGGAYLMDDVETEEDFDHLLAEHAKAMFENELSTWTDDENCWPEQRDDKALKQWFSVQCCVASFDLGKDELMRADLDMMDVG